MYSSNSNKATSPIENTITVTPIKVDIDMSQVYPTTSIAAPSISFVNAIPDRVANTHNIGPTTTAQLSAGATGAKPKEKPKGRLAVNRRHTTLENFWSNIMNDVKSVEQVDAKHQALPLARIKKIMKLDENAKMIAAEAPLLFSKACEFFIQELTMRAWIHTEENKRRTLQRSDIAQAIANYDQFDFLIDIVPREDIKPSSHASSHSSSSSHKKESYSPQVANTTATTPAATATVSVPTTTIKLETPQLVTYGTLTPESLAAATSAAQQQQQQAQHLQPTQQLQILQQPASQAHQQPLQYFITIPGQQHGQQLVQQLHLQPQPQLQQQLPNGLTLTTTAGNPQIAGINIVTQQPQQLILTAGPNGQLTATPAPSAAATQQQQQTALLQNLAQQAAQQQQQQQQQLGGQQQIQLLQQVVTPTGELTNVPITITANQLNLLRLQLQQQQQQQQQVQQQQVIIPTHCINAGAAQQMLQQLSASGGQVAASSTTNVNPNTITTSHIGGQTLLQHNPQQQQQQQQQHGTAGGGNIFLNSSIQQQQNPNSVVSTDRNLGSTYRTNC